MYNILYGNLWRGIMLRLSNIKKDYVVADSKVEALKDINLSFRKNEFVSILGPSGCGKTTLLNIVGGLDKYTSGDLFISGRSTKEFKDRDWDVYRNHRVGFIFQSYNLIPHQTILSNVELALTIAGMSKTDRVKKAKQALDKVGLEGQYNKKPNQLSGGQCQRVAIARALVNDPEILLADEPTGALDTVTSLQIMELVKEIANDRLVIMVTHNPELAEKYSTRIIKLLDGSVVDDTNPFTEKEEIAEVEKLNKEKQQEIAKIESKNVKNGSKKNKNNKEKAKMSFWTAFKLSFQNLFSKKARTIMTSIAGAIGIIGVSLVLSISNGVQIYIDSMQNDMLSGNPITISQTATDLNALMDASSMENKVVALKEHGYVNVDSMIEYLISQSNQADSFMIENDITQDYIDYVLSIPEEDVANVFLDYGLDVSNNIYTDFKVKNTENAENVSLGAIKNIYSSVLKSTEYKNYSTYITSLEQPFRQAPNDEEYILSQYNKLYGDVATAQDEIMIVVSKDRELTDLLLAQLGYYTQEQFMNQIWKATEDEKYDSSLDVERFSYEALVGKTFTYYPNDTVFSSPSAPTNVFDYNYKSDGFSGDKVELKIVGILEPKDELSYGCLEAGFFYTEALCNYIIEENKNSAIVQFLKSYGKDLMSIPKTPGGINYEYTYYDVNWDAQTGYGVVGSADMMGSMIATLGDKYATMAEARTLSLQNVGGSTIPYQIKIYPKSFEHKNAINEYLDKWNSDEDIVVNGNTITKEERSNIVYNDYISLIITMVNGFIDIVTYALVGFTSLSLIVSSVMIAIITYISVVERTKEIGVIRSLGGRKRDVAHLFNAETFIIGFASGLIGIGITYLVSFIANVLVRKYAGISAIAIFPWYFAVIMIAISVLLTSISGLFPSMSAAKKDPVVALRTE